MLKNTILKYFFLLLVCGSVNVIAYSCNCETQLPELSQEETDKYDVIFSGFVKKLIHAGKDNFAEFVVERPYKGLVPRDIKIAYDAVTSCKMPFFQGDEWLIYARKNKETKRWEVNYCERSRKFPDPGETDMYTVYSNVTLAEETKFLSLHYTSGQTVGEDTLTKIEEEDKTIIDSRRDLKQPTPMEKIYLLIASFAGIIIIYFIAKKFVK